MSALDCWGTIEASCPSCKTGDVEYYFFSPDCRGNGPSKGTSCKECDYKEGGIPGWIQDHVRSGKPVKGKQGDFY